MIEATLESAGRSAVRAAPRRAPVPSQAACACICVSVSSVATNRGINRCCAGSGMVNGSLAQITDASPTRTIPECFRHTDGVRPARLRHGPFAGRSRSRVARRGGRICNSQTLIGMRERCESGQRSRFRDAEFVVNSIAFRCTPRGAGHLADKRELTSGTALFNSRSRWTQAVQCNVLGQLNTIYNVVLTCRACNVEPLCVSASCAHRTATTGIGR
jgi:hypothetical protein